VGKQTAVAMTDEDERVFLDFLREGQEVRLLTLFAPTEEAIWVDEFQPREDGNWLYFIWNVQFGHTFQYGRLGEQAPEDRRGWTYLDGHSRAPLIEYSRHNFSDTQGSMYGRIYWSKLRDASEETGYDVEAFAGWYDRIARWIRKHGRQKEKGSYDPYFLPDAWEKYGVAETR
jgi:hypothetical protein